MDLATTLLLVLKASIVLTVLAIGLNATPRDALYLFRKPALLVRSVLSMHVAMPLVAAGFAVATGLPEAMQVALVALSVSPVPPILPKKEMKAGGDEPYAVGLLVALAALAVVTVPLLSSWLMAALGRTSSIAPLAVAKIMLQSILAPLFAGIALRHWVPALALRMARPVARTGNVLLIATALPLAAASWPAISALIGSGALWVAAAVAVMGLLVGHVLGGPNPHHRTVLALSTSSRHPAVALSISVGTGLESRPVLAAILLYLIVSLLATFLYVTWFRRRSSLAAASAAAPGGP